MRIRLTQLDGKLPNLALMKLASWHRARGDDIVFTNRAGRDMLEPDYDRVYGSAIFTMSQGAIARFQADFPQGLLGGTGTASQMNVEQITGPWEHYDYSIYPGFSPSIGFTQRGCRLSCKFCVVPAKEGKPRSVNSIADIWRGDGHPRHIQLLDNDFFGNPDWRDRISEIKAGGFKVCLNQGINVRLIDDEAAEALTYIDYRDDQFKDRRLYTAWDNLKDEKIFFDGVERLRKAGIPPAHLLVYMLVGFDKNETWERVLYRIGRMLEMNMRPFPMVYGDRTRALPLGNAHPRIAERRLKLADFARWGIRFSKLGIPFHEYDCNAKGWADVDQASMEI